MLEESDPASLDIQPTTTVDHMQGTNVFTVTDIVGS